MTELIDDLPLAVVHVYGGGVGHVRDGYGLLMGELSGPELGPALLRPGHRRVGHHSDPFT